VSGKLDPVFRIAEAELTPFSQGAAYESQDAGIGDALGLTQIGAAYSEVPPGKSGCPFHVHHREDEMFVILEGVGEYRFGQDVYQVKAGDVLGAPRGGPEYAHKLTNVGEGPLKYLSISSKSDIEVCEYPDSGKFLVSSKRPDGTRFRHVGRSEDGLDYWDGEEGS
tara:strand:- start:33 stop:530 length:498 start_codon:yes stop_codon:yes gene_type:complete